MSCHPFQVDEVFRSIVEELVALSPTSTLSLALCCKSLTDLSLSGLWERQNKLSVLIKVLPSDAWAYQETDSSAGELVGHAQRVSRDILYSILIPPFCRRSCDISRRKNGKS